MRSLSISASLTATLGLAALMLMLGAVASWSVPALEFNRALISQGQWWRLLSGHWVHYGGYHLAMNASAFLLCGYILLRHLSLPHYGLLLCYCLIGVGSAVYGLNPELHYYAGLSGVLHGLLVAGVMVSIHRSPWLGSAVLAAVALKLVQEQRAGFDPNHPLLLAPVAVDAHLYGALFGFAWGLLATLVYPLLRARFHR